MTHPKDIEYIRTMLPNISADVIEKQKVLQPGNCVGFGGAFKLPMVVKMEMPNPAPNSNSCDVNNCWKIQGDVVAANSGNNAAQKEKDHPTPSDMPAAASVSQAPVNNGPSFSGIAHDFSVKPNKPDLMAPTPMVNNNPVVNNVVPDSLQNVGPVSAVNQPVMNNMTGNNMMNPSMVSQQPMMGQPVMNQGMNQMPPVNEFSTPNQAVMPSGNMGVPPMGNQMMNTNPVGNTGNGGMMQPNVIPPIG